MGRAVWLAGGGVLLGLFAAVLFYRADVREQQDQLERGRKLAAARTVQLRDAIDAWALQEAIQQQAVYSAAQRANQKPLPPLSTFEEIRDEARRRNGVRDEAIPGPVKPFPDYWVARDTKLHSLLSTIVERTAVASLIGGLLLMLAGLLVPLYALLTSTAEKVVDRVAQIPEEKRSAAAAGAGIMAVASAVAVGGDAAVSRRVALGGAAVAAAALVVGAMTLHVPGNRYDLPLTSHLGTVDMNIDDVKLNVKAQPIDVPAENIHLSGPRRIEAEVPRLEFNFPAITAQQKTLDVLASELGAYRQLLERQREHDDAVLRLTAAVGELQARNANLTATVDHRDKELLARDALLADRQSMLDRIDGSLGALTNADRALSLGPTVDALRYARDLNGQNDHLFNQLFRRGVIHQNCDTLGYLKATYPSLQDEECIQHGWKHAFVDAPVKGAKGAWRFLRREDAPAKPSPTRPPLLPPKDPIAAQIGNDPTMIARQNE